MKYLKFSESYSKSDIRDAHKYVNIYARSARFEPEYDAETYYCEKEGTPNSFSYTEKDKSTKSEKVKAGEITAYDENGSLVGLLSICLTEPIGAFKIVVREDATRLGWGLKLLDEAERRGFDMISFMKNNNFSHSGRRLCEKWLELKLKKIKTEIMIKKFNEMFINESGPIAELENGFMNTNEFATLRSQVKVITNELEQKFYEYCEQHGYSEGDTDVEMSLDNVLNELIARYR